MLRRYFASQGFYVVLDYQSLTGGPKDNIYDMDAFVGNWVNLVKSVVAQAPETNGKLLLDFINEPDGCVASLQYQALPSELMIAGMPSHANPVILPARHLRQQIFVAGRRMRAWQYCLGCRKEGRMHRA